MSRLRDGKVGSAPARRRTAHPGDAAGSPVGRPARRGSPHQWVVLPSPGSPVTHSTRLRRRRRIQNRRGGPPAPAPGQRGALSPGPAAGSWDRPIPLRSSTASVAGHSTAVAGGGGPGRMCGSGRPGGREPGVQRTAHRRMRRRGREDADLETVRKGCRPGGELRYSTTPSEKMSWRAHRLLGQRPALRPVQQCAPRVPGSVHGPAPARGPRAAPAGRRRARRSRALDEAVAPHHGLGPVECRGGHPRGVGGGQRPDHRHICTSTTPTSAPAGPLPHSGRLIEGAPWRIGRPAPARGGAGP